MTTQNRFTISIIMLASNSPCEKDIRLIDNKPFKTLKEMAEFTNLSYNQIVDILNRRNKKFNGKNSCLPYIKIDKISPDRVSEFEEPVLTN